MFHLNKIKYLIFILFSFLILANVNALVEPTKEFYINDYANILSEETEEYILNRSVALDNVDGTQIVVVTVPNLDGNSIEDYALNLFRNFGIGDSKKNNGLLLLLALEERQFRVEVGYGLEGILSDGKTGRFQDEYIIPYLREDKWDEGIKNGYDAFYSEIVELNNLEIDYTSPIENETYNDNIDLGFFSTFIAFVVGITAGNLIKIFKNKGILTVVYLMIWFALLVNLITYIQSFLINLFIFLMARFNSNNSYSGGYGRSFRSSSSSRSRSFSGRGGSSGGGGSSRRF